MLLSYKKVKYVFSPYKIFNLVYVMLEALVLNVSSSVLLDCPSSPSSSAVLGDCSVHSFLR